MHLLPGAPVLREEDPEPRTREHHRGGEGVLGSRGDEALGLRGDRVALWVGRRRDEPGGVHRPPPRHGGGDGSAKRLLPRHPRGLHHRRDPGRRPAIHDRVGLFWYRVGECPGAPVDGQGSNRPAGRGGGGAVPGARPPGRGKFHRRLPGGDGAGLRGDKRPDRPPRPRRRLRERRRAHPGDAACRPRGQDAPG
ncbi:MAG: hypothetical protein BWX50_01384 [Euryarchaeota archaeon ADurb.Bin009]|nr:MAG: hypothetical protein BWX50_01384 [Euryarchaeota archaeon ADurb.Bin009]